MHERSGGGDGVLSEVRDTVHCVRNPDAVPMHRCLLIETIIDGDTQALTLACADLGSRNLLIESPHVCPVMAAAHERIAGLSGNEADFLHTGLSEHPRN